MSLTCSPFRTPLALLALLAIGLTGCPPSEALIVVDPTSLDFGEVLLDQTASQQLSITNEGESPATVVFQLTGDGPFEVAIDGALNVRPGDQRLIFVEAEPWTQGTTTDVLRVLWGDEVTEVSLSVTGVTGQIDQDEDGWSPPEDCDDLDPEVNPDAVEVCDGVDNDCNEVIDDTVDDDGDGVFACDDCDDDDPINFPDNVEVCDEQDNNCDESIDEGFDADSDGYVSCVDDCDDDDAGVNPGASELCNGIDENCDGVVDEGFDDADGDGEPFCTDCDDTDDTAFHGNIEICDGIDNDCDGDVDENGNDLDGDGYTTCSDCDDSNGAINPGATEVCDGLDNNCAAGADEGFDEDADGETTCAGDCDDTDPAVNTSATEVCDGVDNDCSGVADEGFDVDADGVTTCGPDGVAGNDDDDCDDTDPGNFPGNPEVCDGLDNDCDGAAEDVSDADGDLITVCDGDCDDADPLNYPGNTEICDGQDNNCDTVIDENGVDNDGDGVTDCTDCDDDDPSIYPGATDSCDGADTDCGGEVEDITDTDGDGVTACDGDCDDNDEDNYPGNTEVCDGQDNDCDPATVDGGAALDGDGSFDCEDCDDTDPLNFPGNPEVCDGQDNDCGSDIDEDFDIDLDGVSSCGPDGVTGNADDDCDDAEPLAFPGNPEVCDLVDNDCLNGADDGFDVDGDLVTTCGPDGVDGNEDDDCDDTEPDSYPGNTEVCDLLDNDCLNGVDDGFDLDGDLVFTCGADGIDGNADDDCDDSDPDIFPLADEFCVDGEDMDCDGVIPEECTSCLEILLADPLALDDVYTIDTDGTGGLDAIDVWCDMTTDGGGWTLIMRTTDDGAANLALLTDYATVYGVDHGDPTLLEPLRVSAQHWEVLAADGDLMARYDIRKVDTTSCDPLRYALFAGLLTVPAPGGGVTPTYEYTGGDPHYVVNNVASPVEFTATDIGPSTNCTAAGTMATPWFYGSCGRSFASISWTWYPDTEPRPVVWSGVLGTGLDGYDETTACGGDPVELLTNDRRSENLHEYYVR